MENLIHLANALYLLSYFVRDMLRLRVLTIVAGSCLIAYFALLPEPLMVAVYWNLAFVAINLARIARLMAANPGVRDQKPHSKLAASAK
jgi:hypothetical protein